MTIKWREAVGLWWPLAVLVLAVAVTQERSDVEKGQVAFVDEVVAAVGSPTVALEAEAIDATQEIQSLQRRATSMARPEPTSTILQASNPVPSSTVRAAGMPGADPSGGWIATRYGISYHGRQMGCPGSGLYSSYDTSIIAVAWPGSPFPCWTDLRVCSSVDSTSLHASGEAIQVGSGVHGSRVPCITGVVVDTCPGCGYYHLDLSEAGIAVLCGGPCDIIRGLTVEELTEVK